MSHARMPSFQRFWMNGPILALLRDTAAHGLIRPHAVATILFDLTQWRDAGEWQGMKRNATWWAEASFDERSVCLQKAPERHKPLCATRGCGVWVAAAFPLHAKAIEIEKNMRSRRPVDRHHGAEGVEGRLDVPPNCTA